MRSTQALSPLRDEAADRNYPFASATAISAARRALFLISAMLVTRLRPPVRFRTASRRKGVTALPVIAGGDAVAIGRVDMRLHLVGRDLVALRHRVGDEHAAAERECLAGADEAGDRRRHRRVGSAP